MEARPFVHNNPDDISPTQLSSIFTSVRFFYEEVTAKIRAKFPFNDQTLKALEAVLKPSNTLVTAADKQCQLEDEFRDFHLSPSSDLPSFT
ncbi:hypothetical protein ACJMK2_036860 [Sinanodonta woodiana]|uniref:Uncharacterized protein n=1 Tax=Sinanodonta woodiana TaxID=1069815 RepID=A0ABD3WMN4_SINWO